MGRYEIDLLARQDDLVLVVEVRARGSGAFESGFASITPRKAQRVRSAGETLWRRRFAADASVNRMRFDVASVTFGPCGDVKIEYAAAVL